MLPGVGSNPPAEACPDGNTGTEDLVAQCHRDHRLHPWLSWSGCASGCRVRRRDLPRVQRLPGRCDDILHCARGTNSPRRYGQRRLRSPGYRPPDSAHSAETSTENPLEVVHRLRRLILSAVRSLPAVVTSFNDPGTQCGDFGPTDTMTSTARRCGHAGGRAMRLFVHRLTSLIGEWHPERCRDPVGHWLELSTSIRGNRL